MGRTSRERMEVKHEIVFLGRLLEELVQGKIRIPRFQRPFVWGQTDMLRLLDSVARGYPIGGVLLCETSRSLVSHDHVGPIRVGPAPSGQVRLVLDGEQRLATLAGCLMLGEEDNARTESVDWEVYYDLVAEQFVTKSRWTNWTWERYLFPVRSLLLTSRYIEATRNLSSHYGGRDPALMEAADELASAFRNYQVLVTTVQNVDVSTLGDIFARVHTAGRRMSVDQMVSALTYREGEFHLEGALDLLASDLERRGFGGLDRSLLLRSIFLALGWDAFPSNWSAMVADEGVRRRLPEALKDATRAIHAALDFLAEEGVSSDRLLPYGMQLVLLGETMRSCPNPSREARELLRRWFWLTSLTSWFNGVSASLMMRMLEELQEIVRGERTALEVLDPSMVPQPFPSRFDIRSARVRGFLLYLASLHPRSIVREDQELEPGRLLTAFGSRALGRIATDTQDVELRQSPANRMFIDDDHRGAVWGSLVEVARRDPDSLASHGFPPNAARFIIDDDREGLIRARLHELIEGERQFIRAKGLAPPHAEQGNIIADTDAPMDDDR